jgi:hypothetical protein
MEPLISGLFSVSNPGDESARSSSFSHYSQVDVGSTYTIPQWTCLVEDFDRCCEEANNPSDQADPGKRANPDAVSALSECSLLSAPPHFPTVVPAAFGPALVPARAHFGCTVASPAVLSRARPFRFFYYSELPGITKKYLTRKRYGREVPQARGPGYMLKLPNCPATTCCTHCYTFLVW